MAWLASLPGRLLECVGNGAPRGMTVTPAARQVHRTRLIGRLPILHENAQERDQVATVGNGWRVGGAWWQLGCARRIFFVDNFVDFLDRPL